MARTVRIGIDWSRTIDVPIVDKVCPCGTELVDALHPDRPILVVHTDPTGRPCPLDEGDLGLLVHKLAIDTGLITAGAGTPKEQACALR